MQRVRSREVGLTVLRMQGDLALELEVRVKKKQRASDVATRCSWLVPSPRYFAKLLFKA